MRHPVGLDKCKRFEHLIHGAKSARKDRYSLGPHQKMHLANSKVVKVEAQVRSHIGIGSLFVWQNNFEPDCGCIFIAGAPVPGRETTTKTTLIEVLTDYDETHRCLTFEGVEEDQFLEMYADAFDDSSKPLQTMRGEPMKIDGRNALE